MSIKKALFFIGTLLITGLCFASDASLDLQSAAYVEGKQYRLLPEAVRNHPTAKALLETTPKGQIQVLAFFNYGCPICYKMEPLVQAWYAQKKPLNIVQEIDVPVNWTHPGWQENARAFYIAQSLGVLEKAHTALFAAIHQDRKDVSTREKMAAFFTTQLGVAQKDFDAAYDSFDVRRKLKQSELLGQAYDIRKIPAFIVAGKYYVDVEMAGGIQQTIDVVNYLVNQQSFTKDSDAIRFDEVKPK